jgi:hypothetical protein
VSSTVIDPGEEALINVYTMMHKGMDGPHLFEIQIATNDPVTPVYTTYFRADFG